MSSSFPAEGAEFYVGPWVYRTGSEDTSIPDHYEGPEGTVAVLDFGTPDECGAVAASRGKGVFRVIHV